MKNFLIEYENYTRTSMFLLVLVLFWYWFMKFFQYGKRSLYRIWRKIIWAVLEIRTFGVLFSFYFPYPSFSFHIFTKIWNVQLYTYRVLYFKFGCSSFFLFWRRGMARRFHTHKTWTHTHSLIKKLVWCGHHKTFFYILEVLLK